MCDPHLKQAIMRLQGRTRYQLRPLQALQLHVHHVLDSIRARRQGGASHSV
jgi:hypothetical protein